MPSLLLAPLEVWLGATAIMVGLLAMAAMVVVHRRDRDRWLHVRPVVTELDARSAHLMTSRTERLIAPLFDAIAGMAQRILRPSLLHDSEAALEQAGPRRFLTARRFISLKVLMVPFGVCAAFVMTGGSSVDVRLIAMAIAPLIAWRVPGMYVSSLASRRSAEITRELPDIIDQITVAVSAGLGLEAAMGRVGKRSRGVLGTELQRTMQDIRIGVDRVVAFNGLARRSSSEDLGAVVSSIVQCVEMGTPLGPVLRARSAELRRKRRATAEEKAQKLSVKLTFPTALCILPSLLMVVMGPVIVKISTGGFGT